MNKLNKNHIEEKERIEGALRDAHEKVESAFEQYNLTMEEEWNKVREAVDAYNAHVSEANDFRGGIASDIEGYISDKTDKWQEGERGQAFLAWQEAFESDDIEEIDMEKPDDLEVPENGADVFEQLPTEPDL